MPGLVRKLLVFAATDGLVLQPLAQRSQRSAPSVKIDYNSHAVGPLLQELSEDALQNEGLEAFGVIGLLKVASSAYLVSISKRQTVGHIWGKPIYVITGVAIVPISTQFDARRAIAEARAEARAFADGEPAEDVEEVDLLQEPDSSTITTEEDSSLSEQSRTKQRRSSEDALSRAGSIDRGEVGIAQDVITRKGAYGRFADKWFSRRGWVREKRRNQGMSADIDLSPGRLTDSTMLAVKGASVAREDKLRAEDLAYQSWPHTPVVEKSSEEAFPGLSGESLELSLLPKLLQTTKLLLGSQTFYFSYDYDITRSLAKQHQPPSALPQFKEVESQYFWNENLSLPFIEGGFDEYVLPIMQGFVGQRNFTLEVGATTVPKESLPEDVEHPEKIVEAAVHDTAEQSASGRATSVTQDTKLQSFLLTLISRRSTRRAGLRYLRRGTDEDGNTANAVETEQILSWPNWDSESKVCSFVQTRGSIPLFFSQMPYTFKPPPALHGTPEGNQKALRKHFADLVTRYGDVEAVSLIDHHGVETKIGEAYEENVKVLNAAGGANGRNIGFTWFDFHSVCRGMKFENVSVLVAQLSEFLTAAGWTTQEIGGKSTSSQTGIVRTNCMDCLDRTNVVQSALAQRILELQLTSSGFSTDLVRDPSTTWFNTLWADNGDAISRAYTGTSALKGDYTRTRKRNIAGALHDLTLTLSRYYYNLFNDFFAQAAIDYLLGTVTSAVFAEFESTMTTADPAIDLRKARDDAIQFSASVVVEASEDLLHGWALLTPAAPHTLRTFPFSESLLLLTDVALYSVRFDYDASQVLSFERIDLFRITSLQYGTYITETHAPAQLDANRNIGLVVRYNSKSISSTDGRESTVRFNTRSVENVRPETFQLENARLDAWSITGADGKRDLTYGDEGEAESGTKLLAFKALPPSSTVSRTDVSEAVLPAEREIVKEICAEIARTTNASKGRKGEAPPIVAMEKDIISANEAKSRTGYLEQIGWSVKKALWG